jgi:hypothetical protein
MNQSSTDEIQQALDLGNESKFSPAKKVNCFVRIDSRGLIKPTGSEESKFPEDDRELDVGTAVAELAHCINSLRLRSNKTMTGKVEASARKGLLAIRN